MDIRDLEPTPPTIDPTPRPRAAQFTRRPPAEIADGRPAFVLRPSHVLAVVLSGLFLVGLFFLIAFSAARPIQRAQPTLTPMATEVSARLFSAPPTAAPAGPSATKAPDPTVDIPTPVALVSAAPVQPPPMIGQGMTLIEPEQAPEGQYLQNVGAQAPHSPRGGVTGPCDGTCAAVPTITSQQAEVIGQQAPHKVR